MTSNYYALILHISSIRLRSKKYVLVAGYPANKGMLDGTRPVVASINSNIVDPHNISIGELWKVEGKFEKSSLTLSNGVTLKEWKVRAKKAEMVKPSGSQITTWITDNVMGIGPVKANKLWRKFGDYLYNILDTNDITSLQVVIPKKEIAEQLLTTWSETGDAKTIKFVQEKRIPLRIARKAIRFHKENTIPKVTEDPYRLLSFCGKFDEIDRLAQRHFDVSKNDIRRLSAALEQVLYNAFDAGHTCLPESEVLSKAKQLVGDNVHQTELYDHILKYGKKSGAYFSSQTSNGEAKLHPAGAWIMEKQISAFIGSLLEDADIDSYETYESIDKTLDEFEKQERVSLNLDDFCLNEAQRNAVKVSFKNRFSIITGVAGTGKTTVLKALHYVLAATAKPRYQMALSGRATARMIEATQESATTIEGFLRKHDSELLDQHPVVIIDEASMLDLVSFFRLSRKLPPSSHLILVGDPFQLPPVGAGLVFHCLFASDKFPKTELTQIKRQQADSDIPAIAESIRAGIWPELTDDTNKCISFITCSDKQILENVMQLYSKAPQKSQILGATKANRFGGIDVVNRAAHNYYVGAQKGLQVRNEYSGEMEDSSFRQGDLILYTRNDWDRNLQNGSLGVLTKVFDEPKKVIIETESNTKRIHSLGIMTFEGKDIPLLEKDIDVLEYAYAITVHKAQGSQFDTVIVPILKSRVLDRTLIYTAITRAKSKVILVGDLEAAQKAVEAPPKAFERQVGLGNMLHN